MSLLSSVRDALETDATDQERFAYRCVDCDEEFHRPRSRMRQVRCPECGSGRVAVADE